MKKSIMPAVQALANILNDHPTLSADGVFYTSSAEKDGLRLQGRYNSKVVAYVKNTFKDVVSKVDPNGFLMLDFVFDDLKVNIILT